MDAAGRARRARPLMDAFDVLFFILMTVGGVVGTKKSVSGSFPLIRVGAFT